VVIMRLLRATFPTTGWANVDLIHFIHTLTTAGRALNVWYSKGLYTIIQMQIILLYKGFDSCKSLYYSSVTPSHSHPKCPHTSRAGSEPSLIASVCLPQSGHARPMLLKLIPFILQYRAPGIINGSVPLSGATKVTYLFCLFHTISRAPGIINSSVPPFPYPYPNPYVTTRRVDPNVWITRFLGREVRGGRERERAGPLVKISIHLSLFTQNDTPITHTLAKSKGLVIRVKLTHE